MDPKDLERFRETLFDRSSVHAGTCPGLDDLVAFLSDALSEDRAGWVRAETARCEGCQEDLARLRTDLGWFDQVRAGALSRMRAELAAQSAGPQARSRLVQLAKAGNEMLAVVREALEGLLELARVEPPVPVTVGMRSSRPQLVSSAIEDPTERPGPQFHVVHAQVEADGRLHVDLSSDAALPASPSGAWVAQLGVTAGSTTLVCEPVELLADGRLTVVQRLPVAMGVPRIPATSLRVVLRPR